MALLCWLRKFFGIKTCSGNWLKSLFIDLLLSTNWSSLSCLLFLPSSFPNHQFFYTFLFTYFSDTEYYFQVLLIIILWTLSARVPSSKPRGNAVLRELSAKWNYCRWRLWFHSFPQLRFKHVDEYFMCEFTAYEIHIALNEEKEG